jgi:hypothetical protein
LAGQLQEHGIVRLLLESCFRRPRRLFVLFRAQVQLRSFLEAVGAFISGRRFGLRELLEQRAGFDVLVLLGQNVDFVLVDFGLGIRRRIGNALSLLQSSPCGIPPLGGGEVLHFGEVFCDVLVAHRLFRGGSGHRCAAEDDRCDRGLNGCASSCSHVPPPHRLMDVETQGVGRKFDRL